MTQILQGRVFEKNMNDFYDGIRALQDQQQIDEAKKQNKMKAMEKYFENLSTSNDLGMYGVILDNSDMFKQYLGMTGVKDVEGAYQQTLKQGLTPDIERKLWMRSQMGNVGEGGGGSQVSPEPAPQTTPTPQTVPNPTLSLTPAEQGFQQNVQTQTATSSSGQAFPDNPSADMGEFATNRTPSQRDLGAGVAGYVPEGAKQGRSFKPTSSSSRRTSEVQNADIGKIQNGRFIPTAYTAKADKDAIITSMLVSSGYRADAIEEKDIRDYENFLINANGLKSREELWSGKSFKIPPRVIGQNEMDIISKLTPELQKQYATLVERQAQAIKAGNTAGAAKAQQQMNQIASKGGTPRSPYTLTDAEYNRFGAIFGVGTREEVDAALMQLAQMDSGQMAAAMDQAKIDNETQDTLYKAAATAQAKANTQLINQQIANSGLSEKDQMELREQAYQTETEKLKYNKLLSESQMYTSNLMAESQDKVVTLYKDLANKQKAKPQQVESWLMSLIDSDDPTIFNFKEAYRQDAIFHNYYLEPVPGETVDSPSFQQRKQIAALDFEQNLNDHVFNKLAPAFGIIAPSGKRGLITPVKEAVVRGMDTALGNTSASSRTQAYREQQRMRESAKPVNVPNKAPSSPSAKGRQIAERYR